MKTEVKIPQQGLTTEYVLINEFNVNIDDSINSGDILFSIESEKATLEIEAPVSGKVVEILKSAGDEAEIGEVVLIIES